MTDEQLQTFRDRLIAAQEAAAKLRAEAFVRYSPVVCGQALRPLTLETYNLLVCWRNPFVCGGAVTFDAIFQFIWAHHPAFGQFAHEDRHEVMRAVVRSLEPRFPTLGAVSRLVIPVIAKKRWWVRIPCSFAFQRFITPTYEERVAEAINEIRRIIHEGLAEFPTETRTAADKSGAPGEPLPFSLQAQVLALMRRELGLSFDETRHLPLKELSQHLRELTWTLSRGKAVLMTPAEATVWREYLDAETKASQFQRMGELQAMRQRTEAQERELSSLLGLFPAANRQSSAI